MSMAGESMAGPRLTREQFVKGAVVGGVAMTAAGLVPGSAGAETVIETPEGSFSAEVINADALVIGTGNGAIIAAEQLIAEGHRVTFVDKGVYRHSGVTNMSWDCYGMPLNPGEMKAHAGTVINGPLWQNCADFFNENPIAHDNNLVSFANHGQALPSREDDGSITRQADGIHVEGQFFRHQNDNLYSKGNLVYDRTMITAFLVSGGRCFGAMGIYLPTGGYRIFRAKAVIAATGPGTWFYGWNTVSAQTIGVADNTCDLEIAAYRLGLGLSEAEFCRYDTMTIYPQGLAAAFGAGMCGDAAEPEGVVDKDGVNLWTEEDAEAWRSDPVMIANRTKNFMRGIAEAVLDGRGTPNGGVYIKVGDRKLRYSNARNVPLLERFGIDARNDLIEALPEMFDHGGCIVVDENMNTEVEGLFTTRAGGTYTNGVGMNVAAYKLFVPFMAHKAGEYLDSCDYPAQIDWAPALAEYRRLEEIRTRQVEDGLRPHVVRQEIQKTTHTAMGPLRRTADMENALAELARIREEDIPRMCVVDPSPVYSKEWREAIEAYNMLTMAEISIQASLLREESRGHYVRPEFPDVDDENWKCLLVCRKGDNDEMTFEKVQFEWCLEKD